MYPETFARILLSAVSITSKRTKNKRNSDEIRRKVPKIQPLQSGNQTPRAGCNVTTLDSGSALSAFPALLRAAMTRLMATTFSTYRRILAAS
jgi:hypothetical protein